MGTLKCWHLERGLKGLNSQHLSSASCSEIVSFILGCWFWNKKTKNGECFYLSGIAFLTVWRLTAPRYQLTLIHTWMVSVCHCMKWNIFLHLPPRCEGRRSGGRHGGGMCGAPLLSWDAFCGAFSDWWAGQGEVKSGCCILLGSCFILARNSIYLFVKVHDW